MSQHEQTVIDRPPVPRIAPRQAGERAARRSLRAQIAKLERELSAILAERFPFIPVPDAPLAGTLTRPGPRLLSLAELERSRDELAGRLQSLRALAAARVEHERRASERLEAMKLEPAAYKFARLPVSDLGQGGCGVWRVRPRLGPIGMLAGWWQVKLSSGCPLAEGPRCSRPLTRHPRRCATAARRSPRAAASRSTRGPVPGLAAARRACAAGVRSSSRSTSSRTSGSARGTCGSGSGPIGAGS